MCVCLCLCLCLTVKEEGQPVKRERDICEVVWSRGVSGGVTCGSKNLTLVFLCVW